VIGVVLAAGAGRRLLPLTQELPKTLLAVDESGRTIFDVVVANLAAAGVEHVVVVSGFAADALDGHIDRIAGDIPVPIETIRNERAEEWNNAYSLWLARELFPAGVLLCNGDTVHPGDVERRLLGVPAMTADSAVLLALDDRRVLGEEAMKVTVAPDGTVQRINKAIDLTLAAGEYIGVSRIPSRVAGALADALERTWRGDPSLYYEDGYQRFIDDGGRVETVPIGAAEWVEVDDKIDLDRAREIACHC
jgi:choline kinase